MWCDTCRKREILYESGELSAGRRAAIERHLEGCPRCRQAYREGARLRELLSPVPVAASRRDLWGTVAARVAGRQPRPRPVLERAWRPAVGLAAVAAAAAVTFTLLGQPQPGAPGTGVWIESAMTPDSSRLVREDPWAGDVNRALDSALAEQGT